MVYAVYGRYSTDKQNPKSADDQIAEVRKDAASRQPEWLFSGYTRKDEAKSARSLAGRDGFDEMLRLAESGKAPFNVILVEDVARVYRARRSRETVRARLKRHGVKILSMADGYIDPDSEAGLWIDGIQTLKAESDLRQIARRTLRGQKAKAAAGFWAGGKPPFGLRRKPIFDPALTDIDGRPKRSGVKLTVYEPEAEIVRVIYDLYVNHGWGLARIAAWLNDPENKYSHLRKGGYTKEFIGRTLDNEVYTGAMVFNRLEFTHNDDGSVTKKRKPAEEVVRCMDAHEAIISRDLWERAQSLRASRSRAFGVGCGGGPKKRRRLLSGLVKCSVCGSSLVVRRSGRSKRGYPLSHDRNSYRRYVCSRRANRGKGACENAASIPADGLEEWVVKTVEDYVLSPEALEFVEEERRCVIDELLEASDGRAERKHREFRQVEKEISNLVQALRDGVLVTQLRAEAETLEQRRDDLHRDLERLEQLSGLHRERIDRYLDKHRLRDIRGVLRSGEVGRVRTELSRHIESITVYPDGRVVMATRNFSLFGDEASVLAATAQALASTNSGNGDQDDEEESTNEDATPDRRSRIMVVAGAGFEPAASGL